ncbi:SPFH/Band 7/PHB domain protein [Candidatus Parcubacteria bacterium]|nr:SPFH/Band 7/PHB domain protein [Patescibacteria group bacterium]MBU4381230.1 SPFH/Band 7/PHB domain protein [Patescibacteria group bacterium]MCG2689262.1 SPFH/Band 7/PHB domain protein [Candidatus Parcubacteria bacterium]
MEPTFLIILVVLAIVTLFKGLRIVSPWEKGIVVRLGRYHTTLESGINFVAPYIDEVIKVDTREQVISVEPQQVITKDNVVVIVDAVIYTKVVDPVKAEFEVRNFGLAATTLAQTTLRNLIGDKSLDETLVARDTLNASLRETLDEATQSWGVKVTRVELQRIDPPEDITLAMSKQMKAERERRAIILEAEGIKQSQILKAEGEAQALKNVSEAAEKYFKTRPEALRRLEVLENVLASNTKFVIPSSSELINLLNLDGEKTTVLPLKQKK